MRQGARIILRIGRDLGEGDVAGVSDEAPELGIGHRTCVDPETVELDAMRRLLLGVMVVRAHGELAAENENHLGAELGLRTASPLYLARNVHAAESPLSL